MQRCSPLLSWATNIRSIEPPTNSFASAKPSAGWPTGMFPKRRRDKTKLASEAEQIGDQIFLLRGGELQLQNQIEELDRVVQRRQAAIVEVRRGILNPTQGEGFDRAFGPASIEALHPQVV